MSKNLLYINDFSLSPFRTRDDGLSGALLLATSKTAPAIQYVVKSEMPHLACNEFMYCTIANEIGLHTKEVKLFIPTHEFPKAVGIRFTPDTKPPKDELVSNNLLLSRFLEFETLRVILEDDDTPEYYLDEECHLFSLDHSEAFNLTEFSINACLASEEFGLPILKNSLHHSTSASSYPGILEFAQEKHGHAGIQCCLSIFQRFVSLHIEVLDEAFDALDEVYPEFVSDYFYNFVIKRQELCTQFLSGADPTDNIGLY